MKSCCSTVHLQCGSSADTIFMLGSRAGAYQSILTTGFDHRVSNMGGSIGAGTDDPHYQLTLRRHKPNTHLQEPTLPLIQTILKIIPPKIRCCIVELHVEMSVRAR